MQWKKAKKSKAGIHLHQRDVDSHWYSWQTFILVRMKQVSQLSNVKKNRGITVVKPIRLNQPTATKYYT